jgi:hypothetical protein
MTYLCSMHGHCKQPKLSAAKQEAHLVALHDGGEHTIGEVGAVHDYVLDDPPDVARSRTRGGPDRSIGPASTLAAARSSATSAPGDRIRGRSWRVRRVCFL